jgi:LuxR family maltose regulon positive regulatory protein
MAHAQASQDAERVAALVEAHGMSLLKQGALRRLLSWCEAVPTSHLQENARIAVLCAWALLLSGRADQVPDYLAQARPALEKVHDQDLTGHVSAIRAYLAQLRGDPAAAAGYAEGALRDLDADNLAIRAVAHFVLGGVEVVRGRIEPAREAMATATKLGWAGGNPHLALSAANAQAEMERRLGQLGRAQRTASEALARASGTRGQPLPIAGGLVSALADLAYEWNNLEEALPLARQALELSQQWGNPDTIFHNRLTLSRVLLATGDCSAAKEEVQLAEEMVRSQRVRMLYGHPLQVAQGRMYLALHDWGSAPSWAAEIEALPDLDRAHELSLVLARVHFALGHVSKACELLDRLLADSAFRQAVPLSIEALGARALAHDALGSLAGALAYLADALKLGRAEKFIRRLVDLGSDLDPLLRLVTTTDPDPDLSAYVHDVRQALGGIAGNSTVATEAAQPGLVEPLSERELEVLAWVAKGLSNPEIGAKLFIAESTVKSHLNTVYKKLDVRNRTEAVAVAREHGLPIFDLS